MDMGEHLYLSASSEEETYRIRLMNHSAKCFPYFFHFCLLIIPRIRYVHCLLLTGGRLGSEILSEGRTRSFLVLPFPPMHEECGPWPLTLELSADIIFQGFSGLLNPKRVR